MTKFVNTLMGLILLFSIVGCGFHLRGKSSDSYRFPYNSVYLDCGTPVICRGFRSAIQIESLTSLVSSPSKAEAVIVVSNEQTSRDALDYNGIGQVASYLLSYQITAQVFDPKGNQIGNDIVVKNQMTINYNNSLILSAQQQENTTWDQIHQNVINSLIRRIIYSHPKQVSPYEAESR